MNSFDTPFVFLKLIEIAGKSKVFFTHLYIFSKKTKKYLHFLFESDIVPNSLVIAGLAQLVEQLICNHQVVSSSLTTGTIFKPPALDGFFIFLSF